MLLETAPVSTPLECYYIVISKYLAVSACVLAQDTFMYGY